MTQRADDVPERLGLVIHAGSVSDGAVLAEWWQRPDTETESRSLRFYGERSIWLRGDEIPASLQEAGCRITSVVGVTNYGGLGHPSLTVGSRVILRPEPDNDYDRNAIGVWLPDGSDQVGYLPRDVAGETMDGSRRRNTGYAAFVAREYRDVSTRVRQGVTVFLGPGAVWAEDTTQ